MKLEGLKKLVKEELASAMDRSKQVYLRGIANMIKDNPDLPLQDIVDSTLDKKGVSSVQDLSSNEAMELNIAVQRAAATAKPYFSSIPSDINPRDFGGGPSSHPLRKGYTGD
jgi:hypothetical protein